MAEDNNFLLDKSYRFVETFKESPQFEADRLS